MHFLILILLGYVIYTGVKLDNEVFNNQVLPVAISPDGRLFAFVKSGQIIISDIPYMRNTLKIDKTINPVFDIEFSPDGKSVAYGVFYGNIFYKPNMLNQISRKIMLNASEESILSISFSPLGKYIAAGGKDKL